MPHHGGPCPRHEGATCSHRHLCIDECVELAYEQQRPRVDAELRRREREKSEKPVSGPRSDPLKLREALTNLWRICRDHQRYVMPSDAECVYESVAALLAQGRDEVVEALKEDAERWRALMASQRIRVMGSAGFKVVAGNWVPGRRDLHLGVEFWNIHPAAHPCAEFPQDKSRDQLTAYVDHLRAALKHEASDDGKARDHGDGKAG